MMTSEDVLNYAKSLHESSTETNPEVEVKEEIQPENNETAVSSSENDNAVDETKAQETEVKSEETETVDKKNISHEDKEKYAFTKLKNKERQKREKLINDYESRLKALNDELTKLKGLNKDSFKNDEEYMNYLVDQKLKERESNELQLAKATAESEAFEEINQQRIMNCFPDEKDREIYNKLVSTSAPQFVELLDKADPDNAILSYLDDSDISPILIRVLMTKPEIRNEILSKRNPYSKVLALDNLAHRITQAKNIVDKKRAGSTKTEKTMPVIGKVTKTESPAALDKNDPSYYNNLLKDLNNRRRGL